MNIKEAKEYIKDSVRLYLKKDEFGEYRVPVVRQRPLFLLGAPGIGKTAIMEQIAQELGIALVSYAMTHHTRQSALGLPYITKKEYDGEEYSVSEYTMSEIISQVYETMEESGIKEGILFLDEINCVSETLAPSMLQFLQYKTFGRHRVPEGWVIVTAGNPPEYNKSVREFDVVTMDRLKLLEVEADYKTWKEYAISNGVHPAIISYLDLKKDQFYLMEMTLKGKGYVTARGWEDLSKMLLLYEEERVTPKESLISQYIRNEKVVREFSAYYELYNKYKRDYDIDAVLKGSAPQRAYERAEKAAFDERLSLMGMLTDRVINDIKEVMEKAAYLKETRPLIKHLEDVASDFEKNEKDIREALNLLINSRRDIISKKAKAGALSDEEKRKHLRITGFLEKINAGILNLENTDKDKDLELVKNKYEDEIKRLKGRQLSVDRELNNVFEFTEKAFGNENEMLILVTELTVNSYSAAYIATFGNRYYQKYNKELMLTERSDSIIKEIEELDL